ncbi:MAG: glycoside hydrolase family 73 protein [Oscillospiraceae bacterium]|nr:glycoside hydrolase family 73 protein [Oscillospiraceae bacterium]
MKKQTLGMAVRKAAAAVLLAALLLGGYSASAAAATMKQSQLDFVTRVGTLASADMGRSGILASLTIAQAILESGWGTSELATNANALFGIKADSRWSGRTYSKLSQEWNGFMTVTVSSVFRAYNSWEESIADHSAFLSGSSRYAAVIGERDYKKACNAIHKAGYATSPDYANKLIQLIEDYGLTSFDVAGAAPPGTGTTTTTDSKPATTSRTYYLTSAQRRSIIQSWLKRLLLRR